MQPTRMTERPPYVTFEERAKEDRNASLAAGRPVYKSEHFIVVTPQGSKDRTDRNVQEWFEQKERDVVEGRFPEEWLIAYKRQYDNWSKGLDTPVSGTSVKNWPVLNVAQVKTLLSFNVLTVEDLAGANEETLGRLGMGARTLKQRAIEFLQTAEDSGKDAYAKTALEQENTELKELVKRQGEQIEILSRHLQTTTAVQATFQVPAAPAETDSGIKASDLLDPVPVVQTARRL